MAGTWLQFALRSLDVVARALPWNRRNGLAGHLRTGHRGEEDAYFWLRRHGYTMVARNWRSPRQKGEIDLIGWEGEVLCFIEVKSRKRRDLVTAEAAIDLHKQRRVRAVSRDYLRRLDSTPGFRFDVVTVYYQAGFPPDITLLRNAF